MHADQSFCLGDNSQSLVAALLLNELTKQHSIGITGVVVADPKNGEIQITLMRVHPACKCFVSVELIQPIRSASLNGAIFTKAKRGQVLNLLKALNQCLGSGSQTNVQAL